MAKKHPKFDGNCLPKQKAQQTQSKINTYTYHSQSVEGQRQTENFEISRGKTTANACTG